MKITLYSAFLLLIVSLGSCIVEQPLPNYLQTNRDSVASFAMPVREIKIKPNDQLLIQVTSDALRKEAENLYNLPPIQGGEAQPGASNYIVSESGHIDYPGIGRLAVGGLKKEELADLIKTKLNQKQGGVLQNPLVIIRFVNLKVTVLGEVKSAGVMPILGEKMTILEAIGQAGDITEYGQKKSVKVTREINGELRTGTIDLTHSDMFASPFYYVMQNDVIMVDPAMAKSKKIDDEKRNQKIGIGLSFISTIALLYGVLFSRR